MWKRISSLVFHISAAGGPRAMFSVRAGAACCVPIDPLRGALDRNTPFRSSATFDLPDPTDGMPPPRGPRARGPDPQVSGGGRISASIPVRIAAGGHKNNGPKKAGSMAYRRKSKCRRLKLGGLWKITPVVTKISSSDLQQQKK